MESFSPDELTSRAKQQQEETSTLAGEIVRWFIQEKHLGEMYQRENVIQRLSEYTSSPVDKARNGLQSVIGDIVDPVQQIVVDGDRYVGAIEYIEFEDSGAYGYIHFDDRLGKRKRVVCAKCVQEETLDENVVHATQGQGSSDIDATWDELVNKVKAHYNRSHDSQPEEIYPGASLVSGTTIGGNNAYHKGNLADRGAVSITPSANNQTIPEGYHNGNGFVEGDGGLTSGNIKNGVSIFGVNGSLDPSFNTKIDVDGNRLVNTTQTSDKTYTFSAAPSVNNVVVIENPAGSKRILGSSNPGTHGPIDVTVNTPGNHTVYAPSNSAYVTATLSGGGGGGGGGGSNDPQDAPGDGSSGESTSFLGSTASGGQGGNGGNLDETAGADGSGGGGASGGAGGSGNVYAGPGGDGGNGYTSNASGTISGSETLSIGSKGFGGSSSAFNSGDGENGSNGYAKLKIYF